MKLTDDMDWHRLPAELEGFADSPNPCFVFDSDGRLILANKAAALYWGVGDVAALAAIDWPRQAVAPSLRRLLRSLAAQASRLERLALQPFGQLSPLTAKVSRPTLVDGRRVLVVIGSQPVIKSRAAVVKSPSASARTSDPIEPVQAPLLSATNERVEVVCAPSEDGDTPRAMAEPQHGHNTVGEVAPDDAVAMAGPAIPAIATDSTASPPIAIALETASITAAPTPLSPRAADFVARYDAPLRFVWETDHHGTLTYVSRDFVTAVGADALPADDETFVAFAQRTGMAGHPLLAQALLCRHGWSELRLAWPLADGPQRLDVELSAAPAETGGFRGFGTVYGVLGSAKSEEVPADAPATMSPAVDAPSEAGAPEESLPQPASPPADSLPDTSPASNVVGFPMVPAPHVTDRRLEPAESAALRTIARVLGGPIGLPRASANDLRAFLPSPSPPNPSSPNPSPPNPSPVEPDSSSGTGAALQPPGLTSDDAPAADGASEPPVMPAVEENPPYQVRDSASGSDDTTRLLREARLREAELRAILDTATDGIVILSGQGRILSLNRAAEALFGFDSADVADHPFMRLLAPASHRIAGDYLEGLARNGVASVLNDGREVTGIERKGGSIPLFMTIGRVSLSGDDDKFCAVLRDITPWKTAEEGLVAAKRKAEVASLQKSDFLAKISHELRTPLNAIIGFSEVMLEERYGVIGNERYREYIGDVHAAGQHILDLVNDLLDLAKIEAGKIDLNFAAVKLADVVQQAVSTMQAQANRQGVILRSSLPKVPPIVADQRSLRQILYNLLSNAIKFSRAGSQVIVSIGLTDEGEVTIRVRDSGPGMSGSDIETALQPFGRISTSEGKQSEGTGLGLPLTKALAEANRAHFHIDSTPGVGTMVQITFPSIRVLAE